MFEVRDGLYYTKDHEWILVDGKKAKFGMADYAQHEMGDLVYVDIPGEGTHVSMDEEIGAMESVKSVEPIYAPISGTIVDLDFYYTAAVRDGEEVVNEDGYDGYENITYTVVNEATGQELTDISSQYPILVLLGDEGNITI